MMPQDWVKLEQQNLVVSISKLDLDQLVEFRNKGFFGKVGFLAEARSLQHSLQ
jgi:hypothetical protein